MRRGLVFGKFMPLHRGHQLLIDTALAQVDDLTIVVYDSDPAGPVSAKQRMPIEQRLGWLAALYPNVEAIVAVPDPRKYEPDRDDPKYAVEYAERLRFLGPFDRVFTSEPGYEAFAQLLIANPRGHVLVDEARSLVPISGTKIRSDLYAHRGWMDPLVYSSMIQKVALVGTESTGKTTLARWMAAEYRTMWTHEFGRELWAAQDGGGTFVDHLKMARRQYEREQTALRHSREFLFCDTNPWTTLQWCLRSYGVADARLHEHVDWTIGEYKWVVCDNNIPWDDDGLRELRGGEAARFHARLLEDLDRRGVEYLVVSGDLDARVTTLKAHLDTPSLSFA